MSKKAEDHPLGGFADHASCCAIKASNFKEGNCKVLLPHGTGVWICLSGTAYQRKHSFSDKLADLLFAWEKSSSVKVTSPLELKGGDVDVSRVQKQLQGGADLIDKMLSEIKGVKFAPVLVFQTISAIERRTIRSHPVTFRGRKYEITALKSGGSVASLPW